MSINPIGKFGKGTKDEVKKHADISIILSFLSERTYMHKLTFT